MNRHKDTSHDSPKAFGAHTARDAAGAPPEEIVHDRLPQLVVAFPRLFTSREFTELHSDLPAGWYGLVARLCRRITGELAPGECFSVLQVKEKLGSLRIYCRGPERFFGLVDDACRASRRHCAHCGIAIVEPAVETALPLCPGHMPRPAKPVRPAPGT